MDNAQYLKDLAATEKANKTAELEQQKALALSQIEQEKAKTMPTFQSQKQQANVQSQLGAKNFAEYLANRGQSMAGISQQAELSRANTLGNAIGGITKSENQALTDYSNQALNTNTQYQNAGINANNTIEQQLQTNLYNDRLAQQQAQAQAIKDAETNKLSWYNATTGRINATNDNKDNYPDLAQYFKKGNNNKVKYAPNIISSSSSINNGAKTRFTFADGSSLDFAAGQNPYTGDINKELYKNNVYDRTRAFSNGYQPKYIGNTKLNPTGAVTNVTGQSQNVYSLGTGRDAKLYYWDGTKNNYQPYSGQ